MVNACCRASWIWVSVNIRLKSLHWFPVWAAVWAFTKHTCGAVNAGMVVIGSKQGRKNPYAKETFEERVDELHHDETGIYPRHAVYVKDVIKEYGTIECRDLCFPFDESTKDGMKERARNCKKIIGFCAKEATKAALKK